MSEHDIYLNSLDTAEEWARKLLAGMKDKGMHCTAEAVAAHCLFALTERLRAVEAERDASAQQFRAELQQMSDSGYKMRDEYESKLSALRAELARKDAALKKAEQALFDHVAIEGDQASFALKAVRAALQPKEPPCKTA